MGNTKVKSARLRGVLTLITALFSLGLVSSVGIANAATATQKTINGSTNTMKVSPLRTDLTLSPGTTGKVTVTAYNTTNTPVILKAIENDFVAGDEKGTPAVILDENSYAPSHSLKRFMVPVPNVTVPANGSVDVLVTITIPKSAQAGGYFGALRFAPANGANQSQVSVGTSVVSLILLTVPGPTVEQLILTNFDVQQNGGTASNFRTPDNLSLLVRFQNKGNVQEGPFGQVYVQKGKKTVYSYNFNQNQPRDQILPDSFRRWSVPIKGMGKFGKYTVNGTFGYGAKGETVNIQKTIWIIPSSYILTGVIALVVLIAIIGGTYMFLRSYKRRILRSSRRRY